MFYIMKYTTVILWFGSLISIEILCTSFNQRVLIVRYFYVKNINSQKNNSNKKAVKTKTYVSFSSEENYSFAKVWVLLLPSQGKSNDYQGLLRTPQV